MRSLFVAGSIALALVSGARADDCRLQRAASLPMTIDSTGRITVPMSVSGHVLHMLIDTGGFGSFLTADAAQKTGLVIEHGYNPDVFITFYGGARVRDFTHARTVALAQMKAENMLFGIMPEPMPSDEDGIIGQDILRAYDIDFDFAGGNLNFYSTDHCEGRVVYWTDSPVAVVPFKRDRMSHIILDTQLDGKDLTAIFDTGAANSQAEWETVSGMFGLTEKSAGMKKLAGEGAEAYYTYPFKALTFGGVAVNNPELVLANYGVSHLRTDQPQLLIGINVMRRFHLYIANAENKLYITPASAH